ncbi:MAG: hypothetical protein D6748_16280 [Calditrichaeota bacterium]|nr:MAG: hypothetical protein D6748_16280 [Calditrichota bacterium]
MPLLSIYIIRTSLIHLVTGFTLGAILLLTKTGTLPPTYWKFLPLHQEIVIFGWILQLVIGVSFWMLPRLPENQRKREGFVWASYIFLNTGILLICLNSLFVFTLPMGILGRIFQFLAIGCYAFHIWPRIRPFGDVPVN